jgi:hypothetical protein
VQLKKILITGASGFIGQIIRNAYRGHYVEIWSRNYIDVYKNESYSQSQDLANTHWWENAPLREHYDIIFHLAEPVKENLCEKLVSNIIESHKNFLRLACQHATICIYPLTAYKYDLGLAKSSQSYLNIKNQVSKMFKLKTNIKLPIFHPIIDAGSGLNRLRLLEASIPYFNFFSDFNSKIPVLYVCDLIAYISSPEKYSMKMPDIYTKKIAINELFYKNNRINAYKASRIFRLILSLFSNYQTIRLLLNGRSINDQSH